MAFGFPPKAQHSSFYDISEDELAQLIKITLNLLEWGITNRQGNIVEVRTEAGLMFPPDKLVITIRGKGGVKAESTSATTFFPFDSGSNKRNLKLFFHELDRQVIMFKRKKK